jgi:large subunit ribosomal protein L15
MPLQKRLPKYGFTSRIARTTAQVRLGGAEQGGREVIDLDALKAADLVRDDVRRVRVFLSGELKAAREGQGTGGDARARARPSKRPAAASKSRAKRKVEEQ